MVRLAFILVSVAAAWLTVFAAGSPAAKLYRGTVEGFESASNELKGVKLFLNAEGDLPGVNNLTIKRDGNRVTGGSWTLTVMPPNAGPTANEKGKLTGSVAGGTLTFNSDGALTGAASVRLTIKSGVGQYARVRSGSGTLNLSPSAENPAQLVGTLTLNF